MDKAQAPVRRARKPVNLFRNQAINEPRKLKVTAVRRRDSKGRGSWFGRAVKKILRWFGWGREKHSGQTRHPQWWWNRRARNRRRNKIAKMSRRINRC